MSLNPLLQKCFLLGLLIIYSNILNVYAAEGDSFRASLLQASTPLPPTKRDAADNSRNFHRFVTRPDIDAPKFKIHSYNDENVLAPGYWFVAFYAGLDQIEPGNTWLGPHIYNTNGELIWSGGSAFGHWNIFDFGLGDDGGDDVLTLLSNHDWAAYILNNRYELQKTVPLVMEPEENKPNMHSFHVIDDGRKALILNIRPWMTPPEVSREVGYDGVCDARYQGFRELDLETTEPTPLFEWNAQAWIKLNESTFRKYDGTIEKQCQNGWDILHTDAIYKISHIDGSIIWRFGGKYNDFTYIGDSKHSRQHHARVHSQNQTHTIISFFDNAVGDSTQFQDPTHEYSRGMITALDTVNMEARILVEFPHPHRARTNARGSMQVLPNGNAFVCWAYSTLISEHTPDGELAMEAHLEAALHSYRAFKYPWVGRPSAPPDIYSKAVWDKDKFLTIVHVSWNGDTEVRKWEFNRVDGSGRTHSMDSAERKGFETSIIWHGHAEDVFAEGFDKDGNSLGKSPVVHTVEPAMIELQDERLPVDEDGNKIVNEPQSVEWEKPDPIVSFVLMLFGAVVALVVVTGGRRAWRWFRVSKQMRTEVKYDRLMEDEPDQELQRI